MLYYIKWKSIITKKEGQGGLFDDKIMLQYWVLRANMQYPLIYHWVEEYIWPNTMEQIYSRGIARLLDVGCV
jgi:hypothetical protein